MTLRHRPQHSFAFSWFFVHTVFLLWSFDVHAEQDVQLPSRCESCALFVREFEEQFRLRKPFQKKGEEAELWLVDALEGQCSRMLEYKLHKEKTGVLRFSKDESSTMKELHKLVDRGVKVDLGMPYEMWNKPSAEVASLKQQCELILEEYESAIERWYHSPEKSSLQKYLCEDRVLRGIDATCLRKVHSEL